MSTSQRTIARLPRTVVIVSLTLTKSSGLKIDIWNMSVKHKPQHKYDCVNCKFNWCCGPMCACHLKMPYRLRVELWNNSKSFQTDWNGSGQPTKWGKTPTTEWSLAFHHPDLYECVCIRHFSSLSERTTYVKQTFTYYSPELDDLTVHY